MPEQVWASVFADLKNALCEADPEHPAPLFRLTSRQSSVVQQLLDRHGQDVQVLEGLTTGARRLLQWAERVC